MSTISSSVTNALQVSSSTEKTGRVKQVAEDSDDIVAKGMQARDEFLKSVNLTLSAEGIAHMKQELAKLDENKGFPVSEEQNAARVKFFADFQAYRAREGRVDSSHPLFTDPYTSDRALSVSALVGLVAPEASSAVEDAVYAAIKSPVQQSTDTTEAVDVATQQMKLDAIVNKMIPEDKRERASVLSR